MPLSKTKIKLYALALLEYEREYPNGDWDKLSEAEQLFWVHEVEASAAGIQFNYASYTNTLKKTNCSGV